MYSLKVINAKVLDLESESEKICDIGIEYGKIIDIGNCNKPAKEEINADGRMVSPGFIDIHMHEEIIGDSIGGDNYDIANKMLLMGVTTCVGGNCGNNRQSIDKFMGFIEKNGAPVNYLTFIGHNYLRDIVGIQDRYRKSTKEEIQKMQKIALSAIDNGAIGISFGLEYSPGIEYNEISELCKYIADKNILLSAHYRKDARYGIDSIKEMINLSRDTGIPMEISHLGSCTAYGMMEESLKIIKNAIDEGIDVTADCYPYDAFSTFIGSSVFDEGCFQLWNKSFDSILLTEEPYKGVRCDEKIFKKVRKEYPDMLVVSFVMNEEEVIEALKAPFVMVASDGIYRKGQGHPRGAGTFPRVLGKYVREMKKLSLAEALKKMTIMPAERLGLSTKGEIKEGYDADLVIFDPEEIIDVADFQNPIAKPKGIHYVIINGEIAVKDNEIKRNRLGKIIKGSATKQRRKIYD